ncbi:DUF6266 family protein [Pedobacter heparinus]|uniref:Uncharacterized protein n=1 Tax=Pedobacter heparinus (strain ATCC 13125 / DSM 2366 / CIP 104194 / JCM 7457 / NBRC 12017 / NCIMB 9290 / NRRL B-14731 / HIM 762-3) TaxID=485917 RepID=C6XZ90_PEDHD|nr:DUF6266 family protein [Pedobacter heparinus]ACU02572.1 hypothetical protein Phep_0348 [Pedobacter heparinus DSM 2366]
MGRIKKGILGGFSGKVGAVVGASWRGVDYMRSLPEKSKKAATTAQLAQQNKMALFRGFLLGLDDIIARCFQNIEKYTPMNDALSYNMKNAIAGVYPDQSIAFDQLLFSKGELLGSWLPNAVSTTSNAIDFSWENGNFTPMRSAADQVTVVVYDPVTQQFCKLENAALRSEKAARLILPDTFKGHGVHCYISFYSESMKIAATNEYLGVVEVV